MADMEFDEFAGGYAPNGRASRVVHLAGAACSVALMLGLGVWGYKLAVRDVTGIPVMRAMAGPMRIAPANPGGVVADNQGLSVNAVAASGTALPIAETVVLAPRAVDLTAEDIAGLAVSEASLQAASSAQAVAQEPSLQLAAAVAPAATSDTDAAISVPSDDPAASSDTEGLDLPVDLDSETLAEPDLAGEGLTRSLRPMPRPAAQAVAEPTVAALAVEVDPSTIAVGTRLVQLGAFDDEETARSEWTRLQGRFGELLAAKSMVVQSAQSGGRTFFRLRATGFDGEEDTRRFCVALLAENVSCIPVAQR